MKKIVALLMALSMVLSLAICANAADVAKGVNSTFVEDANGLITATIKVKGVTDFSGMKIGIDFDESKVALLQNDKATAATTSDDYATVVEAGHSAGFDGLGAHAVTIKASYIIVNVAASATAQWYNCADDVQFVLYFQKNDGATIDDTTFVNYYKTTAKTYYKTGTTQVNSNVEGNFGYTVVPYTAPTPVNPFSATVAGTTITCAGKVDATVANYGVEFTAESTVEGARAQKYYGAMNGDTVSDGADGVTTFTFGDWDGTFEIVLEGVHAGSKTLNFFANDTIIADTTFTVVVE